MWIAVEPSSLKTVDDSHGSNPSLKKKTLSTFYRLTEVDLHYCSFNTLLDLRSHHSFFSFFFSILLSLVLSLSQYSSFSLFSCYFCVFAFFVFLFLLFLVFAFPYTQLDCQPQPIFLVMMPKISPISCTVLVRSYWHLHNEKKNLCGVHRCGTGQIPSED